MMKPPTYKGPFCCTVHQLTNYPKPTHFGPSHISLPHPHIIAPPTLTTSTYICTYTHTYSPCNTYLMHTTHLMHTHTHTPHHTSHPHIPHISCTHTTHLIHTHTTHLIHTHTPHISSTHSTQHISCTHNTHIHILIPVTHISTTHRKKPARHVPFCVNLVEQVRVDRTTNSPRGRARVVWFTWCISKDMDFARVLLDGEGATADIFCCR